MRILITGHLGLVGSIIWNNLIDNYIDAKLFGLDLADGIDIRDPDQVNNKFKNKQFDLVIHCAALKDIQDSFVDVNDYFQTNVMGTRNIIKACEDHNVPNLLFISTGSIEFSKNPYSYFKAISEHDVNNFKGTSAVLRLESVLKSVGNTYKLNTTSLLDNLINTKLGHQETFTLYGNPLRKFISPTMLADKVNNVVEWFSAKVLDPVNLFEFESPIRIHTEDFLALFIEIFGDIDWVSGDDRTWEKDFDKLTPLNEAVLEKELLKIKDMRFVQEGRDHGVV